MPDYLSTFPAGFEPLVAEVLPVLLRGAKVHKADGGTVLYRYDGNPAALKRLSLFGNTFLVLRRMDRMDFRAMAEAAAHRTSDFKRHVERGRTFRVRFHENGRFAKVPVRDLALAERAVTQSARLTVDRTRPDVEFWYIRRLDRTGYYALLLHPRAQTEKTLHPGELRPELARLICLFAGVSAGQSVLDPFSGYGAIPAQLAAMRQGLRVMASDCDPALVKALKKRLGAQGSVERADARALSQIPGGALDHIITDPPWGLHASIDDLNAFYAECFAAFRRVLRPGGRVTILTSAIDEASAAARGAGFTLNRRLHILVNGKKASLLRFE